MAPRSAIFSRRLSAQCGVIYLAVLFLVAATGAGLATFGRVWSTDAQREREADLLDAGRAYRRAIARYHDASPGTVKTYPPSVDSLLLDPRFPNPRRHLRRPIPDPMTGVADWILLPAPGGGIAGVASRSEQEPLKRTGFSGHNRVFAELAEQRGEHLRYRDWEFIHSPGMLID